MTTTTATAKATTFNIEDIIAKRVSELDAAALRKSYIDQDEFVVVDDFLSPEIMEQWATQLESLKPHIHRNFIPKHKKGGSVDYNTVKDLAPAMNTVYQSPALLGLMNKIADANMQECPNSDLHRCALYAYTEEGDHIGWHYDTSYYKDRRWTLLVGFLDNSSARLVGKLHTKNAGHAPVDFSMQVAPGTLVLFNGDKVHHAVTPTKAGESRYMVSMQYVTNADMNPFMRFISNMKDSVAYFGLKAVFVGRGQTGMSIPAVVLCDPNTYKLRVAGLPVIERLVVAAHRAGATSITVVSKSPLPSLTRSTALKITVKLAESCPPLTGPALILSTRQLVQAPDLKRLMERHARLTGHDGTPLPAGVLSEFSGGLLEDQLSALPAITAEGVAQPITDAASAAKAAKALWASLSSPVDGWVDKHFNRPAGRYLSKILIHTPASPNQVSIVAILIGVVAAWLFAQGNHRAALWGAILFQLSAIVDCVDGELARVMFKESPLGRWLDIIGDQVVHISIFAGIGIGLYRARISDPFIPLVVSAGIGVVIALIVVVRGQLQPESAGKTRLRRLMDAAASRDFSLVLLVLTIVDKLSWFLWMTAIGVHVFWLLALGAQLAGPPAAATLNPDREKRS